MYLQDAGKQRRDTMHMRVKADAFIPAGGRPNSINKDNWQQFLDSNGKPSSMLIVEGANIFNTAEARERLFEKGVAIVKDSSANKVGWRSIHAFTFHILMKHMYVFLIVIYL